MGRRREERRGEERRREERRGEERRGEERSKEEMIIEWRRGKMREERRREIIENNKHKVNNRQGCIIQRTEKPKTTKK